MHVGIDEAWDDGASLQIDRPRRATRQFSNLLVTAEREDPSVAYRKRASRREWRIDDQNLAVHKDGVGRLSRGRSCKRNAEDGRQRSCYEPLAHDSPPRRSPSPDGGEHTTPPS